MAEATYGITAAGFVKKTLAIIKSELEAAFKATFGDGADVSAQGPYGQIIGIIAEREALIWEGLQANYNSQYPDTAEGVSLDNANALVNVSRQHATYSLVYACVATGTPGTVIPTGSIISVSGNSTAKFLTLSEVTIGIGGTITVDCIAQAAGMVQAPANSLTVIETLISGWTAFNNPDDAVVGVETQTGAQFTITRYGELQQAGSGPAEAIRTALMGVLNATAASVVENDTLETVDSVPAKSIWCIVQGGTNEDVAAAIFGSICAGIGTYGGITVTVTDTQGVEHDISFSRPSAVPIICDITVTKKTGATITGPAVIADILAFGAALNMGDDVIVYPAMMASMNDLPASDIVIKISKTTPTTDDNIAIALNEIATFDADNITVHIS